MRLRTGGKVVAGMCLWYLLQVSTPVPVSAEEVLNLNLEQSIHLAINHDPGLAATAKDLAAARADVEKTKGSYGWKVNAVMSNTREKKQPDLPFWIPWINNDFVTQMTFTYPLTTGGQKEGDVARAVANTAVKGQDVEAARQDLVLEVTDAYFSYLKAADTLRLTEKARNQVQTQLDIANASYRLGSSAKIEVLRAEVELADRQQNVITAQNGLKLATNKLQKLLGLTPDTKIVIQDDLAYEPFAIKEQEAIETALQRRPEVLQARYNISANEGGLRAAQAGLKPTVVFDGAVGTKDSDFPADQGAWRVTLQASWNIFDSGTARHNILANQARVDNAKLKLKQTEEDISLEVQSALANVNEAEQRVIVAKKAAEKADEELFIAQERYKTGMGSSLEILDMQVAWLQAHTNSTSALYDFNIRKAQLKRAIGEAGL